MTKTKQSLAVLLLLAATLATAADGVLTTPKGAAYHAKRCLALMRSKNVITMTVDEARTKGLRPCGICYRPKGKTK